MKKLAKIVLIIIAIFAIIIFSLIIANTFDSKPNSNFSEYENYIKNPKLEDNIFVYLNGIDSINESNIYASGKQKIIDGIEKLKVVTPDFFEKDLSEKEILKGEELKKPECVLNYYENNDECNITLEQINKKISDNKGFFERLEKANNYSSYNEIFVPISSKNSLLLEANRIIAAKIVLEARKGNINEAYNLWLYYYNLNKKILLGSHTAVGLAISILNHSFSLKTLAALAHYRPEIVTNNYNQLYDVLDNITLKDIKVKELTMVEFAIPYYLIKNNGPKTVIYLINDSFNQYFEYYNDFIKYTDIDPKNFYDHSNKLRDKYSTTSVSKHFSLRNPIARMVNGLLISGLLKTDELLLQIHRKETYLKLLNASIDIRNKNISTKDIQKFLDDNKSKYYNLLNGAGFKFNEERNSIYTETIYPEKDGQAQQIVKEDLYF